MSVISASKKLSKSGINININAIHNGKIQSAIVYIEFDTKQTQLLSQLLRKYCLEKVLTNGVNMNNGIYTATSGDSSIALTVPENRITQNIALLYNYLLRTKLTSQQAKQIGSYNYSTLSNDIKSFDVSITGKCKTFIAALNSNGAKIDRMMDSIVNAKQAERENGSGDGTDDEVIKVRTNGADKELVALYLSIVLGNIPCRFRMESDGFSVILLCSGCKECIRKLLVWKDTFQGKVKTFLGQSGAPGSPSAGPEGESKWKSKCKNILECQNKLAEIYSGVRGFSYKFSDVEELKRVDSKAIGIVRGLKV